MNLFVIVLSSKWEFETGLTDTTNLCVLSFYNEHQVILIYYNYQAAPWWKNVLKNARRIQKSNILFRRLHIKLSSPFLLARVLNVTEAVLIYQKYVLPFCET